MTGFRGFDNSISKKIMDKLETICLRLGKIEVEEVAIIKFRVNKGGGDGNGCFDIKIGLAANTTKLTDTRITRFRQSRDLVRKSEMFIEDKAKIASRVSGVIQLTSLSCIVSRLLDYTETLQILHEAQLSSRKSTMIRII